MDALRSELNDDARNNNATYSAAREPREKGSSTGYKMISYLKGVKDFKVTLQRKYPETQNAVVAKLDELRVQHKDVGYGQLNCQYGQKNSAEYVTFKVNFVVNGGQTSLPGAEQWYTKVSCSRTGGSGQQFRELGKQVIHAARYINAGHALLDHSVTTWGLY